MRRPAHPVPANALIAVLPFLAALLLPGCGGPPGGGRGFQMPPTPVEVAEVSSDGVTDRFRAVGTVEAEESVTIVNMIAGAVRELPFAEGQPVAAGDLIALLDDSELAAESARAEALRDQARTNHERARQLFGQRAASQQQLDDATLALQVAEANATVARARLDKTRIRSPFAGVAGRRLVSPGAFLPLGTPITEVASVGRMKIGFSAPERYLSQLRRQAAVTVTTTAYPGETFSGRISVVDPILDGSTHTVQMVAIISNRGGRLRSGMSGDVTASLGVRPDALTVPDEAVFGEGDQSFVYVVKSDSTVTRQAVTLGARDSNRAEVTAGLKAGDRVVSAGYQKLFEGAKVMPVPAGRAPEAAAPGQAPGPPTGAGKPAPSGAPGGRR